MDAEDQDRLRGQRWKGNSRSGIWKGQRGRFSCISRVRRFKDQQESIKKLALIGKDGVLRVGGRLANAPIPYSAKHPAVLPSQHRVTELIIQHYHVLYGHSGAERIPQEDVKGSGPSKVGLA